MLVCRVVPQWVYHSNVNHYVVHPRVHVIYHHRHHMGETEPVAFNNFEDIEIRFQQEFEVIHEKFKKKR